MRCSQCGFETGRDVSFCGRCGNLLVDAQEGIRIVMALELERQGRVDEAKDVLLRHLALEPNRAAARRHLGTIFVHQGKLALGIAELEAAVDIESGYVDAWYDLGVSYAQKGDIERSIRAFRKTLAIDPGYHMAHYRLGRAFMHQGDLKKAHEHLQSAVESTPELICASYFLGILCRRLARPEQARAAFERVLELSPNDASARHHLDEVIADLRGGGPEEKTREDKEDFSLAG